MGVAQPNENLPENVFYRNGEADELLFVHHGEGTFESVFGRMDYGPGDYIVIPIGTTWRLAQKPGSAHRSCTSNRRPRSCRRTATATSGASCSSTRPSRSATSAYRTRQRRARKPAIS